MRFQASELAEAAGGRLAGPDAAVDGATYDSRLVRPGQLFVAVVAERDGHDFVGEALRAGAAAYVTSRDAVGGTAIEVADTGTALLEMGRAARSRLSDPLVGITGSVGKTTTKDLLAAVLARSGVVAASAQSLNNELGVPVTLLEAPEDAAAVVVEMGARGAGHIALLCDVARPTVGVVTVVEAAHTALFGSVDDVARAKGELVEALAADGTAVLNADDQRVAAMSARTSARCLTFGVGSGDVRAIDVRIDDDLAPRFHLASPWGATEVRLAIRGAHNVVNAAAAAAAAFAVGASLDDVAAGLAQADGARWRMEVHDARSGARIINDAYNANPASMQAALDALAAVSTSGRRVAVLGVMAELGGIEVSAHRAVADRCDALGVEVIAVGTDLYGVVPVGDIDEAVAAVGPLDGGDTVLVKGSRIAGLERVADALVRGSRRAPS